MVCSPVEAAASKKKVRGMYGLALREQWAGIGISGSNGR